MHKAHILFNQLVEGDNTFSALNDLRSDHVNNQDFYIIFRVLYNLLFRFTQYEYQLPISILIYNFAVLFMLYKN